MLWILHVYFLYILVTWIYPYETRKYCCQVKDTEHHLRYKLFPANAWMKFFHCMLRPIGTVAGSINRSDEDIQLDLIFFSPFEELRLRTAGIMKSKGIHRVYEPSPVPTVPLSTLGGLRISSAEFHSFHAFWTEMQPHTHTSFIEKLNRGRQSASRGNATSTIPHKYSSLQKDAFECRCQWCWPNLAEGQPSLRDQHLVVELWTAPASRGRPLCGQNWEAPTEVPVWGFQARMGN
jgi:hypothetical protein